MNTSSRVTIWEVLVIGIVAVAYQLPFFDRAVFMMDEGHILQFADMLAEGGELYRDATLLPLPGAFYLLAGVFEIFGPSIRVARWVVTLEFALLCVFGFFVLRHLVSRPFAFLGVAALLLYRIWAFPHWHMYSYSTLSMCLLAGGLVPLMRFLERGGYAWAALAGLATGLAVACKQDYGLAGLLAMSAVLAVRHLSADASSPERGPMGWIAYIAPAVGVGAIVAIHYLIQGLFGEMLQQTLLNHLRGIATFEYTSLPPLLPLFAQEPELRSATGYASYVPGIVAQFDWTRLRASAFYNDTFLWDVSIKLFFYAPYVLAVFGAGRLWHMRAQRLDPERRSAFLCELALYGLALALLLALNKPVDYVHVVVLYWPLLLLGVVYLAAALRGRPRLTWTLGAAAAIPLFVAVGYTISLAVSLVEEHPTPLPGDRAGVSVPADEARVIDEMVDWVVEHSAPGDAFPVLPYFPLVSFLADRDGPHRATYTLWPIEYIEDRERQIIDAIDSLPGDRLLYHFTQFPSFPRMPEYAPELFAHLVSRYEIERVFSSIDWGYMAAGAQRTGPPPGTPLIDFDDADVALWVETDGRPNQRVPRQKTGELFETALWPLRPVFALRPLSGNRRSVAAFQVEVPDGARLVSAVSVHPAKWFDHPPSWVHFGLRARVGDRVDTLFQQTLRPHTDHRDRRWFSVDVDLERYAGQSIELQFTASCERASGELHAMGGWEIPRLLAPPLSDSPAAANVTP